jgi:cysteine desulfurase
LEGIAVSSGSACSSGKVGKSHVLEAMGVAADLAQSAIRVSLGWNTSAAEIARFLETLNTLRTRPSARAAA